MTPLTHQLMLQPELSSANQHPSRKPSILFATSEPELRDAVSALLAGYDVNVIWVGSIAEAKAVLAHKEVAAFFCGFWLVDGTYRDVISYLKHQQIEAPLVIVSAPTCAPEYKSYLAALKTRAFGFLGYPYSADELDEVLKSALGSRQGQLETIAVLEPPALAADTFPAAQLSPAT